MKTEIVRAIATLIVGLILAYFSLRIYFRQKEYEIVKQRYLEQSLDIIAGELESIASTFSHNWARCLDIVKEYRDAPQIFNRLHLSQGYLELNGSNFNLAAHHRLRVLTGSNVFWDTYQLALSRHLTLNSVVAAQIPQAISAQLDKQISATPQDVVDTALVELKDMNLSSEHFATLREAIYKISTEFEQHRLSLKTVHKFSKLPAVQLIVKEVTDYYAAELKALAAAS